VTATSYPPVTMHAGIGILLLVSACKGGGGDRAEPAAPLDVPALIAEGRRLAESTWPDARLSGIRIGEEVVPGSRAPSYAVRLTIDLERDPQDPTARSAAILCSPECVIRRAKVKSPPHDWPACGWADALAAARGAGLRAAQPTAVYGNWASATQAWELRETAGAARAILVDAATCAIR
jgi:hypothetical protein